MITIYYRRGGRKKREEREGGEKGGRKKREEREGGEEGGRQGKCSSIYASYPDSSPVEKYFSAGGVWVRGYIVQVFTMIHTHTHTHTQLPELIHSREKGRTRWMLFLMANIGFYISFVVLLLIAIYEEELNTLIQ